MWSVDDDRVARDRSMESVKTFLRTYEAKQKSRMNFALAIVVSGSTEMTCDWVASRGVSVECVDLIVSPHETRAQGCSVPEDPRQLRNGVLHVVNLPEDTWRSFFASSIDLLAKSIEMGYVAKRPKLIYSRGNNLRFIADKVFLDLGIKQVLYLDNDVCVKDSIDEIFHISGGHAVVAAARTDSRGRQKSRFFEHMDGTSDFIKLWGFTTSFNAGVVLLRTKAMCEYGLMHKMIQVQNHHNHVEQLWTKGTNQPPFEIAAAKTLKLTSWSYNCRIRSDDVNELMQFGLTPTSPLSWIKGCRVFHPSVHDLEDGKAHSCVPFSGLGEGV